MFLILDSERLAIALFGVSRFGEFDVNLILGRVVLLIKHEEYIQQLLFDIVVGLNEGPVMSRETQ